LLGLVDPTLAQSTQGIVAMLVVLMLSLWAHAQGDKLGAEVPRHFTLSGLRQATLSEEFLERVDSYGQIRIRPVGTVEDIEGYPPLGEETREAIRAGTWKFPAELSIPELEARLATKLTEEHDLAEVSVSITGDGLAEISAAPATGGLSKRVPSGKRAVSIETLLPTGLAVGDHVRLALSEGSVTGAVVSARTDGGGGLGKPDESTDPTVETDGGKEPPEKPPRAPTTDGGEGSVTVALTTEEARRVVQADRAKLTVQSRGKSREYEAIDVLQRDGNQFRTVTVVEGGAYDGKTIGELDVRDQFGVAILAIRRKTERIVAPRGAATLSAGDELVVTGPPDAIRAFREGAA
jgi:K+/H+ antiporter YhaU regulatory subunit KhtT